MLNILERGLLVRRFKGGSLNLPSFFPGIISLEVLDAEPVSEDGLTYQYKVKKIYQPFKVKKSKPESKPKLKPDTPPPINTPPVPRQLKTGIKLRERKEPKSYSLDDGLDTSSSEDDDGDPFPKERTVVETWTKEVKSTIYLCFCVLSE